MFGAGKKSDRRPLRFSGTWYPGNAELLRAEMVGFARDKKVEEAKNLIQKARGQGKHVLAIVAPHAGYTYCGITAATAYAACAQDKKYPEQRVRRVFLLGPSHYKGFRGAALSREKSFATAFGDLPVDTDAVDALRHEMLFTVDNDTHRLEHSLEMQLAFIKRDFANCKLVPIIIGQLDDPLDARQIGDKIKDLLRPDDLLIVSSDFTHFGERFDYTPFAADDHAALSNLDLQAAKVLQRPDTKELLAFYKRTGDTICGIYALAVLTAILPPDSQGTLLDYRTSRDAEAAAKDDPNSVSYMALVYTGEKGWGDISRRDDALSQKDKDILLEAAKRTIATIGDDPLGQVRPSSAKEMMAKPGVTELSPALQRHAGVFVTIFAGNRELRGCIGSIIGQKPLLQSVIDNAAASAQRDPRFLPIRKEELDGLHVEISVLTRPRKIASYKEIVIGRDGIILSKHGRQAVFLPHVAKEQGWGLEETLTHLAEKAGLDGSAWRSDAAYEVFEAESFE